MGMLIGTRRIIGLSVGSRVHQPEMVRAIDANGLTPAIDRVFPFDPIAAALHYQEAGSHVGKICLSLCTRLGRQAGGLATRDDG